MQRAKMTWKMSARHAAGYASPETHLGGSAQVYWKTFLGDHSLLPSPASTGLEFAFRVSFSPRLGNPSIRTCFGPKKGGRSMELYSYDYALKALWLYTSEPEWASNWSNCERQPRSTPTIEYESNKLAEICGMVMLRPRFES